MEEGIAGSVGKLHEAEALIGVVPFDDGLDRGAGRRFKPLRAEFRCRSEIAPGRFVVVVCEGAPPRRAKISVFVAHMSAWGQVERPYSEMRQIERQRIPVAACGLQAVRLLRCDQGSKGLGFTRQPWKRRLTDVLAAGDDALRVDGAFGMGYGRGGSGGPVVSPESGRGSFLATFG